MSAFDKQVGGDHYKKYRIQPSQFISENRIGWNVGNAIKYAIRHQDKNGKQDLEKAIHYLQMEIERCYPKSGIKLTCDHCKTEISPELAEVEEGGHFFCSESCFRGFHAADEFEEEAAE